MICIVSCFYRRETSIPPIQIHEGLPTMKLAIRIFVLTMVFAGVAAAVSPATTRVIPSHQSATGPLPRPDFPGPVCAPGIPTCPGVV
jgi:hypothetical protein